ncbi:LOW QUALITY PROTEIN: pathogenesis-related protein STH-2-like [Diospyros lotus]|uniref:LOW QUALITY PROTEIN: pathogenesis-related protein STH-2-like n=1 Tax=Diospyros lotus TaxID=55363 RepID=UPI00225848A3|nr:LOW QUALITY PROTEIN: pathogenesis-related protein STH-2-like [Diospyros lotus]
MGVTCFTQELACPNSPIRMFMALIQYSSTLIPKLLPQFIKSVEVIEGDAAAGNGSIEQVNFTRGSHFKYVEHIIDAELDKEKLVCKYTLTEGGPLGDKLASIAYGVRFEAASNGGCIYKITSEYTATGELQEKEEEIRSGKESAMGIYKVLEAYILGKPHAHI